jgi:hypothetical protein
MPRFVGHVSAFLVPGAILAAIAHVVLLARPRSPRALVDAFRAVIAHDGR